MFNIIVAYWSRFVFYNWFGFRLCLFLCFMLPLNIQKGGSKMFLFWVNFIIDLSKSIYSKNLQLLTIKK